MKLNKGNWLNAKGCKDGDVIEFLDEGAWQNSQKFTYDDGQPVRQLVFKIEHNGEEKNLSLIKPSRMAMIDAFGDDTETWVGKKAKITLALNTQGGKSIMLTPLGALSEIEKGNIRRKVEDDADATGDENIPF